MADPFETAHLDGYRVRQVDVDHGDETSTTFWLVFVFNGEDRDSTALHVVTVPSADYANHAAERARLQKLFAALTRFLNEGGSAAMLLDAARRVTNQVGNELIQIAGEPCCIESEETHARTFLLPEQRYLRIIEDDFSEVLSLADMTTEIESSRRASAATVDESGLDSF